MKQVLMFTRNGVSVDMSKVDIDVETTGDLTFIKIPIDEIDLYFTDEEKEILLICVRKWIERGAGIKTMKTLLDIYEKLEKNSINQ